MDTEQDAAPSKSSIKRELAALNELADEMVQLPERQRARLPMTEPLREAVKLAARLRRGAYSRQIKTIGRMLRDPELAGAMRQGMQSFRQMGRAESDRLHRLEVWRERLIEQGDEAVQEALQEFPGLDRQHLRQLVRSAQKERREQAAPRAFRELFRYLRQAGDADGA